MPYTPAQIARVCHEANAAIQAVHADPGIPVSPPWSGLTAADRDAAINGVLHALAGQDPEQLHDSWCAAKYEAGWVHGPIKDAVAKTHPCLVDYDELPERDRAKDDLFHAVVGALGDAETPLRLDERLPSVAAVLGYLEVNPRLPDPQAAIARLFRANAVALADALPASPELTVALRKLLEGKDAAVRASLPIGDGR